MKNREQLCPLSFFWAAVLAVIIGVGCTHSDKFSQLKYSEVGKQRAMSVKKVEQPSISGEWVGTWGVFHPNQTRTAAQDTQRQLVCHVAALTPDKWQATFEGECGRPYKYTIQMLGSGLGMSSFSKAAWTSGKKMAVFTTGSVGQQRNNSSVSILARIIQGPFKWLDLKK